MVKLIADLNLAERVISLKPKEQIIKHGPTVKSNEVNFNEVEA